MFKARGLQWTVYALDGSGCASLCDILEKGLGWRSWMRPKRPHQSGKERQGRAGCVTLTPTVPQLSTLTKAEVVAALA